MTGNTSERNVDDAVQLGRIGEVIEANTGGFVAEAQLLHTPPALGSVAVIHESGIDTLAFVTSAETTPKDAGRRPTARGADYESEDEFYARHPEISRLIRTTFSAVIVAHRTEGQFIAYLPPRPPRLHAFVYPGDVHDIAGLGREPLTLRNIAAARLDATNEFLPAAIRTLASVQGSARAQEDYLRETGRRLVHFMRDDMRALQTVLAKIRPSPPTELTVPSSSEEPTVPSPRGRGLG